MLAPRPLLLPMPPPPQSSSLLPPLWLRIHTPAPCLSRCSFAPLGRTSHGRSCCVPARSPLFASSFALVGVHRSPLFALIRPHVHACPAVHLLVWVRSCLFGFRSHCEFVLICACPAICLYPLGAGPRYLLVHSRSHWFTLDIVA